MNRSIRRLYLTLAAGFGLLMLMLGYWQVVAADGLKDRPGNEQTAQAERLVDRGRIVSADGKIMAASRAVRVKGQKVFERLYPQGDLAAQTIGYTSEAAKTGPRAHLRPLPLGQLRHRAAPAAPQPEREGGGQRPHRPRHARAGRRATAALERPGRGGRAGAAHRQGDRDGLVADLRPPARGRRLRGHPAGGRAAPEPHGPGPLPARLELQDRDRLGGPGERHVHARQRVPGRLGVRDPGRADRELRRSPVRARTPSPPR